MVPRRRLAAGLVVYTVVYVAVQVARATQLSATWDEPIHLTAGYAAVAERDFRVDPTHPPFARAWAALPLLVLPHAALDTSTIDRDAPRAWLVNGYAFARDFLYGTPGADRLLLASRVMAMTWGIVLGFLIFAWSYEWLGGAAAGLALSLYVLEPNLGAHAILVTTDFGITTFAFGAAYFLWRLSRQMSYRDAALLALFVALAAVTKFSAVLLVPAVALLLPAAVMRGGITWRHAAAIAGGVAALTIATIWAVYGFRYLPSASPTWQFDAATFDGAASSPWLVAVVSAVDRLHLLPQAYSQGFLIGVTSVHTLPAYLAGEVRTGGWWYYFPVAFVLKTPLLFLGLGLVGLTTVGRRRGARFPADAVFVIVPPVIWLLGAMASGVNLGVRHILPIYPFVVLIAAAGARACVARRGITRAVAVAMMLIAAIEVGRAGAYPLTFFNGLAGGPANGFRYLADSNLGWGGSLKSLKHWMDRNAVGEINLAYFGSVDPAYYGIHATYLPSSATFLSDRFARPRLPGYVAISGTVLGGVYLPGWWRQFYAGFRDRQPVAIVPPATRIYWVDRWPDEGSVDDESAQRLGDALLFGLQWPEQAIVHYRRRVERHPRDAAAWNGLSTALARVGRLEEALDGFRRVQLLAPGNATVQRNIAVLEPLVMSRSRP